MLFRKKLFIHVANQNHVKSQLDNRPVRTRFMVSAATENLGRFWPRTATIGKSRELARRLVIDVQTSMGPIFDLRALDSFTRKPSKTMKSYF
jgi:hypothetical protein